jgi:hypothetical protein
MGQDQDGKQLLVATFKHGTFKLMVSGLADALIQWYVVVVS